MAKQRKSFLLFDGCNYRSLLFTNPLFRGLFHFLGCGNLPAPWLKIRPKADYSHGRLPKMPPIELCFLSIWTVYGEKRLRLPLIAQPAR